MPWNSVALALAAEVGCGRRAVYRWWAGEVPRPLDYALRAATERLGLPFRPWQGPLPSAAAGARQPSPERAA